MLVSVFMTTDLFVQYNAVHLCHLQFITKMYVHCIALMGI